MILTISLFISVLVADTGKEMSIISAMKFASIQKCEEFVLRMSDGYPYIRNNEGALVLTVPSTGNVVTAKCANMKSGKKK